MVHQDISETHFGVLLLIYHTIVPIVTNVGHGQCKLLFKAHTVELILYQRLSFDRITGLTSYYIKIYRHHHVPCIGCVCAVHYTEYMCMAPDFVQFSVSASTDAQQWPECLLTPSATEYPACVRLTTNLRTDNFFFIFQRMECYVAPGVRGGHNPCLMEGT
jgi:hypothetical protein